MREIKFRAWGKHENSELCFFWKFSIGKHIIGIKSTLIIPETFIQLSDWEQFTGLYDCDGKEIYEGDVIVIHNLTYEIVFVNGEFCGKALNISNPVSRCDAGNFQSCEIIGNIHEVQA
jgi:hypothetical protein